MFEYIKSMIFWDYYNRPRVLNEDILILILDYLPFEQIIELKKVSPQFSYCVKELAKRKMLLVVFENRKAYKEIFHTYHNYTDIRQNKELFKNSVINLEALKLKECLKFIYRRCSHLMYWRSTVK